MRSGTSQSTTEATFTSPTAKGQRFGCPQAGVHVRPPSSRAQEVLHAGVLSFAALAAESLAAFVKRAEESYAPAVPGSEPTTAVGAEKVVGQTDAVRTAVAGHVISANVHADEAAVRAEPALDVFADAEAIAKIGFGQRSIAIAGASATEVGSVAERPAHEGYAETDKAIADFKAAPVAEAAKKIRSVRPTEDIMKAAYALVNEDDSKK